MPPAHDTAQHGESVLLILQQSTWPNQVASSRGTNNQLAASKTNTNEFGHLHEDQADDSL